MSICFGKKKKSIAEPNEKMDVFCAEKIEKKQVFQLVLG